MSGVTPLHGLWVEVFAVQHLSLCAMAFASETKGRVDAHTRCADDEFKRETEACEWWRIASQTTPSADEMWWCRSSGGM